MMTQVSMLYNYVSAVGKEGRRCSASISMSMHMQSNATLPCIIVDIDVDVEQCRSTSVFSSTLM